MQGAPQRRLKARYHVRGPFKEKVTYRKCWMDKETKSLQSEMVTEEMECFHVFFPQGHSIRVTSRKKLEELGLHIKPRIVDMETGDVVDTGGDPYDFGDNPFRDEDVALIEDKDTMAEGRKAVSKKAKSED